MVIVKVFLSCGSFKTLFRTLLEVPQVIELAGGWLSAIDLWESLLCVDSVT